MYKFNNLSIKNKLVWIIMLASMISMILAYTAFITCDIITFKNNMQGDLKTISEIIGDGCTAALIFDNETDAKETLSALKAEKNISGAVILDRTGNKFAAYQRGGLGEVLYFPSMEDYSNDILDFSKIEAGRLDFDEIEFDLYETIEKCLDILSIKAREKQLNLVFDIDPEVPTALIGDPVRLSQIIINLTNNSIKFTEKGKISISCEVKESDAASVLLHFSISDSGIGIPDDKIDTIFESFRQADGSTTRKYGGTGLGLTISKQLIEIMGGKIWVQSKVGKGSTFHFYVRLRLQIRNSGTDPLAKTSCLNGSLIASNRNISNDFTHILLP